MTDKKQNLYMILTGIFLTNALLAEMIGVKIFSAEQTLGIPPAQWKLFGDWILDFNLTAGVILWPVVFITTDVINEYFGKKGVRRISFLTVGCISFAFLAIYIITLLPPAAFWLDVNSTDADGNYLNIHHAFNKIFNQSLGIIIGSLVAFLIGQFLDVYVFQKIKRITGGRMVWLRATGSTLISQLVDSFVVLFIAFYFLAPTEGRWSVGNVFSVGMVNYVYKFSIAILLTPLIYLAHYFIDRYLGKEEADRIKDEAMGME
jgi:queuosine precursor transporter